MQVDIRPVRETELSELLELIIKLRRHLDDPENHQTVETLNRAIFSDAPDVTVFVADTGENLAGYVMFQDAYEPCYAARGAYVCDLFVRKGARGNRIGRRLLDAAARHTADRGRHFLWLVTLEDNNGAQAFYRELGAVSDPVHAFAFTLDVFEQMAERGRSEDYLSK